MNHGDDCIQEKQCSQPNEGKTTGEVDPTPIMLPDYRSPELAGASYTNSSSSQGKYAS